MVKILLTLYYITFLILWTSNGAKDSILWSRKGHKSFKFNEHIIFVIERGSTLSISILSFIIGIEVNKETLKILNLIPLFISCILSFIPIHNGFYYLGRSIIDGSYEGFWSEPRLDSSAKINFSFYSRFLALVISLLLFILSIIY